MARPCTELIPVVDLMGGQVVRGVRGERAAYRPIVSALCRSSDPLTVARVLCQHCATGRLYVADLDALTGGGVQVAVLRALLTQMPELRELWLDGGFANLDAAEDLVAALGDAGARLVPVFGSESLRSREVLAACFDRASPVGARAVLSLDRRGEQRLDDAGAWDAPALWPARVIVMTLERVGSGEGPDLDTLRQLQALAPQACLVGAGGLRSPQDLTDAAAAGAAAWLVASALHDLQLPAVHR